MRHILANLINLINLISEPRLLGRLLGSEVKKKKNQLTPPNIDYALPCLATSCLFMKFPVVCANTWACMSFPAAGFPGSECNSDSLGFCDPLPLPLLSWRSWSRVFDPSQFASAHHCPPHSCFLLYLLASEFLAVFCILGILSPSHGFSAGGAWAPSADKDI